MITVKIGVTCDDVNHYGSNEPVLLDADLSPDGLVKLSDRPGGGWWIRTMRGYGCGPEREVLCPVCAKRLIDLRGAW